MSGFQVHVPSNVGGSDVRSLTDAEKSAARKMGVSEERYREGKADLLAGEERRRQRGRELGEAVEQMLHALGQRYQLLSVTWNVDTLSWRLEIETPNGKENVVLSWELVDDVLDARTKAEFQRLRNMVFFGLGRRDMIFGSQK